MKLRSLLGLFLSGAAAYGAAFTNGGFECGLEGWRFWTREREAGSLVLDEGVHHAGKAGGRVEHHGAQDWSLEPGQRLDVKPGDLFEVEIWLKVQGEGSVTLCASTWDRAGQAVDWACGSRTADVSGGWQKLRARLLVPEGVVQIQPRLIGYGATIAWVDDFDLRKAEAPVRRDPRLVPTLVLSNRDLTVTLLTSNATFRVHDSRSGRDWPQRALAEGLLLTRASTRGNQIEVEMYHAASGLEITGKVEILPNQPEFTVELAAAGELLSPLRFPYPFESSPGDYLVVPMNEGISYPVEDETVETHRLVAYGGHGICMAFWGVTDGEAGQMAILETPDNAAIQLRRIDRRLTVAPEWDPQCRAFGYARRLRYIFFDHGGHVAMAKRYRGYARQVGLLKTLAEKRRANPNVDLLLGAVNVWCWDQDAVALVKEMQGEGIEHILWSNAQSPENLRALNGLGVLTSRYDIYQDVMDPAQFPKLQWTHPDWTTAAWPNDIILDAGGHWIKGWGVEAKDGSMISCGVMCDWRAARGMRAPASRPNSPSGPTGAASLTPRRPRPGTNAMRPTTP